jgi:nitroreductase
MRFASEEELLHAQSRRRATQFFDGSRGLSEKTRQALEESVRLTPSAYNLQPWKIICVTDDDLKRKLRGYSFNQQQIEDCSMLMIICALENIDQTWFERLMELTAKTTGISRMAMQPHAEVVKIDIFGTRKDQHYELGVRHCYLVLGNLLTSAAMLGLDTCPIEGFMPSKYDEILRLNGTGWKSCIVCAVGYAAATTPVEKGPRIRFPIQEVIDRRD